MYNNNNHNLQLLLVINNYKLIIIISYICNDNEIEFYIIEAHLEEWRSIINY